MARELVTGANFTGRTALLMERLRERGLAFFVGPYAEAALSGLASTVADEIEIYAARTLTQRPVFDGIDIASNAERKPPTLSGGEQVLLALHCFSRSAFTSIGIDTALEQLDAGNRTRTLAWLGDGDFDAALIDNRIDDLPGWTCIDANATKDEFACDLAAATAPLAIRAAPTIAIEHLSFSYPKGRAIFESLDLVLEPGNAWRLSGPNGAGKTTLFKLLAGVLAPSSGGIELDGKPYAPWREGNRIFALATQNPDHQWCGATLAEDVARRRTALKRHGLVPPGDPAIAKLAACLGVGSLDAHLYELPLAARKRLSWLWPLSGALPWVMLDEPTVGQDRATRGALAAAISRLCELGFGVVFITHDDEFAQMIVHRILRIGGPR